MGDRNHLLDGPDDVDETPRRTLRDQGATLVEYVLMVSLIALVCVVAINYLQQETAASFSRSSSAVVNAGT